MTVASRSHGGNKAGGLLGELPGQGEGWDLQAQLGTVQRLPPTRRRGQLPLASLDLPSIPPPPPHPPCGSGSPTEGPREHRLSHLRGRPWGRATPLGPSRLCHPEMTRGDRERVNSRWESRVTMLRVTEVRGTLTTPHLMSGKRERKSPTKDRLTLDSPPPRCVHWYLPRCATCDSPQVCPRDGQPSGAGGGVRMSKREESLGLHGTTPHPQTHVPLSQGLLGSRGALGIRWDPVEEKGHLSLSSEAWAASPSTRLHLERPAGSPHPSPPAGPSPVIPPVVPKPLPLPHLPRPPLLSRLPLPFPLGPSHKRLHRPRFWETSSEWRPRGLRSHRPPVAAGEDPRSRGPSNVWRWPPSHLLTSGWPTAPQGPGSGGLVDLPGPRGVRVALETLVGPVDPAGRELELQGLGRQPPGPHTSQELLKGSGIFPKTLPQDPHPIPVLGVGDCPHPTSSPVQHLPLLTCSPTVPGMPGGPGGPGSPCRTGGWRQPRALPHLSEPTAPPRCQSPCHAGRRPTSELSPQGPEEWPRVLPRPPQTPPPGGGQPLCCSHGSPAARAALEGTQPRPQPVGEDAQMPSRAVAGTTGGHSGLRPTFSSLQRARPSSGSFRVRPGVAGSVQRPCPKSPASKSQAPRGGVHRSCSVRGHRDAASTSSHPPSPARDPAPTPPSACASQPPPGATQPPAAFTFSPSLPTSPCSPL